MIVAVMRTMLSFPSRACVDRALSSNSKTLVSQRTVFRLGEFDNKGRVKQCRDVDVGRVQGEER